MGECPVCTERTTGLLCSACGRSYDRDSNCGGGDIFDVIVWASKRTARLRGSVRRRGGGVSVFVTSDELTMLADRVSAGEEVSEEDGWTELMDKIEAAQKRLTRGEADRG